MEKTDTIPELDFDLGDGIVYLYPIYTVHTDEDVTRARVWLKGVRQFSTVKVTWTRQNTFARTDDMPLKVPDAALLKISYDEISKLHTEIDELKDKLKQKENIKKGSVEALQEGNRILRQRNERLQEQVNRLLKGTK